jgi:hypothetical protein
MVAKAHNGIAQIHNNRVKTEFADDMKEFRRKTRKTFSTKTFIGLLVMTIAGGCIRKSLAKTKVIWHDWHLSRE